MFQVALKKLREDAGLSQDALAKRIGVSQSTVGMWESGRNKPEHANLEKLAEVLGVGVNEILGESTSKGTKIPVLGVVPAGIPIEAIEDIIDWEEVSPDMMRQGDLFALRVKGDSMEPRIKDGDIVIVLQQPAADSGDIVVATVNGEYEATLKKFIRHENGISLTPLNQAYSPLFFTFQEIESLPVKIIGKVIELRGKF